MIGKSSAAVSDMVRGVTAATGDEDFGSIQAVSRLIPSIQSDFDLEGTFTDNIAPNPLGLRVYHKALAWNTPGNTKYVIVEYTIFNTSTSTMNNLFAGIFADWDIDDSTYASNRASFDAANKMGYAYYSGSNGTYVGIKLLSQSAPVVHYAIDNVTGGGGGVDLNNGGYSEAEKYTTLSTNRANAGVAGAGGDIIDVVSTGPISIVQGDSVVVAFALLAGDSLTDLQNSAANAQVQYDSLLPLSVQTKYNAASSSFTLSPNPANTDLRITFSNQDKQTLSVEIKDALGQNVKTIANELLNSGTNTISVSTASLKPGVYVVQVISKNGMQVQKFVKE